MDINNSYKVLVRCENCNDERYFTLEKGTSVRFELAEEICEKCGCEIIQKKRKIKS